MEMADNETGQEGLEAELNSTSPSMDGTRSGHTGSEAAQISPVETGFDESTDPTALDATLDTAKSPKNSRKRTKTGCLTCRRRRIKCGEERPICNNCIKSKRNCEGYNNRSVLREGGLSNGQYGLPQELSPGLHSPNYPHHPSSSFRPHNQHVYDVQLPTNTASFTPLAPRPTYTPDQPFAYDSSASSQQSLYSIQQTPHTRTSPPHSQIPTLAVSGSPHHMYMQQQQLHDNQTDGFGGYTGLSAASEIQSSAGNGGYQYESNETRRPSNLDSYEENMENVRQKSLTTFIPSMSSITDAQTAHLFRYFITVSAPILSDFERRTLHPSTMFSGKPVPEDQQGLWTFVMPRLALQSPPLLQAMLSLASLQMARLQGNSILQSLKYYHVALLRVAKAVGQPSKRSGIDIFAATLLLGYYEVASAEHQKWNSHLLGARQLLMETDFLSKSKRIMRMKAQADSRRRQNSFNGFSANSVRPGADHSERLAEKYLGFEREIDEDFVHDLAGSPPAYADHNDTFLDSDQPEDDMTAKDIDDYEIRRDLFWWFLKQDAIQSMVSSNRLLLSFGRWTHCPPRAPMNRADAPYGTFDHLTLLIGRVTDFGARDVGRKKRAVEASGGVWRPPPGMSLGQPRPPQIPTPGPSPRAQQQWQSMPPMKGMIPDPPPAMLPRGFTGDVSMSPSSNYEDLDLEAATAEAEFEWSAIKAALQAFEARLGPDFAPLSPEESQTVMTPFGPARHYKSYAISVIWLWYYVAQIIHIRFHPSMPPTAMMAAGIAAQQTAKIANEIALTVGGLMPTSETDASSTLSLGAALMDSTLALFYAGVQYQDAAQRAWTVASLRAISQRMGWGSAETIASGCERSWEAAAQMGRGPPYIRTMDPWAKDDRVAGRPLNSASPVTDDNDRRFIPVNAGARVHWAVGILGIEDELGKLTVV